MDDSSARYSRRFCYCDRRVPYLSLIHIAVVEPASVPLLPSGTSKKVILVGFIFLAVAGASAWILFGREFLWSEEMADASVYIMEHVDFKDTYTPGSKEMCIRDRE